MVTPDAKRNAVAHAREKFGLSERRACRTIRCRNREIEGYKRGDQSKDGNCRIQPAEVNFRDNKARLGQKFAR
jgi:hypothetical protein